MRRLLNDFQVISKNYNNNELSRLEDTDALSGTCGYITMHYSSNLSNDILDDTITTSDVDLNTNNSYTDLVFIEPDTGKFHEIGNSEILFDALFDFIVRNSNQKDHPTSYSLANDFLADGEGENGNEEE